MKTIINFCKCLVWLLIVIKTVQEDPRALAVG